MPLNVIDENLAPAKVDALGAALEAHRAAYLQQPYPSARTRIAQLKRLEKAIIKRRVPMQQASSADFGHRAPTEVDLTDGVGSLIEIRHAYKSVRKWMRRRRHLPHWILWPATSYTFYQPLGVIGIMAPWNYPILLAIAPLANVIAAGNRAMIKPSELAPRSSEVLSEILAEAFPDGEVTVHDGGPDVGKAFSQLCFDHLVFTGSPAIGRLVYQEAAKNLVPVTLELGGRSPMVIDRSANLKTAIRWGIFGKLINSGQTCVATDHIYVHESQLEACLSEIAAFHAHMRPTLANNEHQTSIITDRHYQRLQAMVQEAEDAGVRTVTFNPANEDLANVGRRFPLTAVVNPPPSLTVSREEIFGTVLPVFTYTSHDEVIQRVQAGERPLSLYLFGKDERLRQRYMRDTHSGVFSCDGTFGFWAVPDLHLGGVGNSGIGRYQGEAGFQAFSHARSYYRQSPLAPIAQVAHNPPGKLSSMFLDFFIGRR